MGMCKTEVVGMLAVTLSRKDITDIEREAIRSAISMTTWLIARRAKQRRNKSKRKECAFHTPKQVVDFIAGNPPFSASVLDGNYKKLAADALAGAVNAVLAREPGASSIKSEDDWTLLNDRLVDYLAAREGGAE